MSIKFKCIMPLAQAIPESKVELHNVEMPRHDSWTAAHGKPEL